LFVEGHVTPGGRAWYVAVKSSFRPRNTADAQTILHSETTVSNEVPDLTGLDPETWTYHKAKPTPLPAEESLLLIKSQGPEQRIILGPLYNDVLRESKSKEPVLIYPEGTRYPTYFPREQLTNPKYPLRQVLVNPCFLDSIYQACAAHLLVIKQRVYLPWEITELGIVDVPREKGLYVSHTRVVEETEDTVSFDVVMVDGNRRIRYYARGARFRLINL
jgi:hypothetical protein